MSTVSRGTNFTQDGNSRVSDRLLLRVLSVHTQELHATDPLPIHTMVADIGHLFREGPYCYASSQVVFFCFEESERAGWVILASQPHPQLGVSETLKWS